MIPDSTGPSMAKTIAVDFDGVLHGYRDGWRDGAIYDAPVDGAASSLRRLRKHGYRVLVHSTRANDVIHRLRMEDWLKHHEIPFDEIWCEPGKPIAEFYIDDRAIRFTSWDDALRAVLSSPSEQARLNERLRRR
jgi:hypothetical protein